jgi:hypothetical protein
MYQHHLGSTWAKSLRVEGHANDVARTLNTISTASVDYEGRVSDLETLTADHDQRIENIENNDILGFDLIDEVDGNIGARDGSFTLGSADGQARSHIVNGLGLAVVRNGTGLTPPDLVPINVQAGILAAELGGAKNTGFTFGPATINAIRTDSTDDGSTTFSMDHGFSAVLRKNRFSVLANSAQLGPTTEGPSMILCTGENQHANAAITCVANTRGAGSVVRGRFFVNPAAVESTLVEARLPAASAVAAIPFSGVASAQGRASSVVLATGLSSHGSATCIGDASTLFAYAEGLSSSLLTGRAAFGNCATFAEGTISADGVASRVHGISSGIGAAILATADASACCGIASDDGKLISGGVASLVCGSVDTSGIIRTEHDGNPVQGTAAIAHGRAQGSGIIEASAPGAFAGGYAINNGTIVANSDGSIAHGSASGVGAGLAATNSAACVFAVAAGAGAVASATSPGSFASGLSQGVLSARTNGGAHVFAMVDAGRSAVSSGKGSMVSGYASAADVTVSGEGSMAIGRFDATTTVAGNDSAAICSAGSTVSSTQTVVCAVRDLDTSGWGENTLATEKLRVTGPVGRRDVCPAIVAIDTLTADPASLAGTALRDQLELAYPNASARLPQGSLVHFSSSDGAHVSKGSWHVIMGRSGAYIIDASSQIHQFSLP